MQATGTSRSWSDADPSILEVRLLWPAPGVNFHDLLYTAELARGAKPLIRMEGNTTFIDPPEGGSVQDSSKRATERKTIAFSFDKSYWSAGPRDEPGYASQETLYNDVGKELLDHSFNGFNACIFACESPLLFRPWSAGADWLCARWTDRCACLKV